MISKYVLAAVLAAVSCCPPNYAANAASFEPITVKAGYVNMPVIKEGFSMSAAFEQLKADAEAHLRKAVEDANKKLQEAKENKASEAELQKLLEKLQSEIQIRQQTVAQLVNTESNYTSSIINSAIAEAAAEKGLTLVVDGSGVITGGQQLIDHGMDITLLAKSKLQKKYAPPAASETATSDSKSKHTDQPSGTK